MTKRVTLTRPIRSAYSVEKKCGVKGDGPPSPSYGGEEGARSYPLAPRTKKEGSPLTEALDLADKLTASDLKKLYDHVALKLASGATDGDTRTVDMWATAAYEALVDAIGTGGAGMAGPLAVKRLLSPRSSWAPVEEFLAALGVTGAKPAVRLSVLRLLAKLLVEHCAGVAQHVRAPLSAKLVANNTGNLAAIFDNAFPGYVASGLAPMLIERLARGGAEASE